MPNIREYENKETINPSSEGAQATALGAVYSGRAIAGIGDAIGSAISYGGRVAADQFTKQVVRPQIMQGMADFATLQAQTMDEYNRARQNADPRDTGFMARFNEEVVQPRFEKFRERMTTQESQDWADQKLAGFRDHLFVSSQADDANAAGHAAKIDYGQAGNATTQLVYNDPTAIDYGHTQIDQNYEQIKKLNPGMSPEAILALDSDKQKQHEEADMAAVKGRLDKDKDGMYDPAEIAAVKKDIAAGRYKYLDGAQAGALTKIAEIASTSDQENLKRAADRRRDDKTNAMANKVLIATAQNGGIPPAGMAKAIVDEISNDPDLIKADPAKINRVLEYLSEDHTNDVTDSDTMKKFDQKLLDPIAPLNEIEVITAAKDHKLSAAKKDYYIKTIGEIKDLGSKNPAVKDAMDVAKTAITFSTDRDFLGNVIKTPRGDAAVAGFNQEFIQIILPKFRDGSVKPEDLNPTLENSLVYNLIQKWKPDEATAVDELRRGQRGATVTDAAGNKTSIPSKEILPGTSKPQPPVPANLKYLQKDSKLGWNGLKGYFIDQNSHTKYSPDGSTIQ